MRYVNWRLAPELHRATSRLQRDALLRVPSSHNLSLLACCYAKDRASSRMPPLLTRQSLVQAFRLTTTGREPVRSSALAQLARVRLVGR